MARTTASVRFNKDGTVTVRVGRHVEHISTEAKTNGEVWDQVKYALVSKGVNLSDISLIEFMEQARKGR